MNKRTLRIIALSMTLAVTAVSVTDAGQKGVERGHGVKNTADFQASGLYTGSLSGQIVVGGESVFIGKKTAIYQVGKGQIAQGTSVTKSPLYVAGVMKGTKLVATMVLVGEPETTNDFSLTTLPDAEKDPKLTKRAR
jgi:hypothetical protein